MRRLSKYLVSNIIKVLLLSEFAGLIIFAMVEFFQHIDDFSKTASSMGFGLYYVALRTPYYFNLILPLCFLISILIFIIMMIRGNEIIIVRTAGVSTISLMKPILALSLVLVLLSFTLSEWVIPSASSSAEFIYRVKIKKEQSYVVYKNDKIWFKRGTLVCNIDFFDAKHDEIRGITILELSDKYSVLKRYDAATAKWRGNRWTFTDVVERTFKDNGIASKSVYPTMKDLIKEPPSVFKIANKEPEEMSYQELQRHITKLKRNGNDAKRYMVDLYDKLASPFVSLIMVLVAFSVGLRYSKTKHVSKGILTGVVIGVLYLGFQAVAKSLGYSEIFPPLFAAWFSNLLFLASGIIGIATIRI